MLLDNESSGRAEVPNVADRDGSANSPGEGSSVFWVTGVGVWPSFRSKSLSLNFEIRGFGCGCARVASRGTSLG